MDETNITGWSLCSSSVSKYFQAKNQDDLKYAIDYAVKNHFSLCAKGAGNSYGDEFQNENNLVVDMTSFNNIVSWDSEVGVMVTEPGVSLQEILRVTLPDNWVLAVVPGTRLPTIGGCIANNVHGKNSFKEGNFGDWVIEFDLMLSSGDIITCSRKNNSELFYSAIGGMGMLGIFTRIALQLKKVKSTGLKVKKWTVTNLDKMIECISSSATNQDYIIGQIDCFKKGNNMGRGTLHSAVHADNKPSRNNFIDDLEITENIFSVIPARWILTLGKIFMNSLTMRCVSNLKYYVDSFGNENFEHTESFPKFNFLLDRVSNWPKIFKHGFYEFEPLIPTKKAKKVIEEILSVSHKYKMPPFLSGIKLHRKDDFLLSYSMDGFSVGFDFPVLPNKTNKQNEMFLKLHEIVMDNYGLIYLAKDNLVTKQHFKKMYNKRIDEFLHIKNKYDPDMFFQSNMFRRLFLNSSTI